MPIFTQQKWSANTIENVNVVQFEELGVNALNIDWLQSFFSLNV